MAIARDLKVVVELIGNEQSRTAAYHKALLCIINKCMCEVNKDAGSSICQGINRGTGREGLFDTCTEGRMQ